MRGGSRFPLVSKENDAVSELREKKEDCIDKT